MTTGTRGAIWIEGLTKRYGRRAAGFHAEAGAGSVGYERAYDDLVAGFGLPDGRMPDRLEALVPSELDRLPDDPFAKGRFLYGTAELMGAIERGSRGKAQARSWVLGSQGPAWSLGVGPGGPVRYLVGREWLEEPASRPAAEIHRPE
jgi:hypothetical protein